MKIFLEQLGFTHIGANLWNHGIFGMIQFEENTSRKEIIELIYKRGWTDCQTSIRVSLGIESLPHRLQ